VLDANAVLDFSEAGPGALRVERLLQEALHGQSLLLISVANWGEVFYLLWQRRGEQQALRTIARLSHLPLEIIPVDLPQALKAGEIKARHQNPVCRLHRGGTSRPASKLCWSLRTATSKRLGRHFPILWISRPLTCVPTHTSESGNFVSAARCH